MTHLETMDMPDAKLVANSRGGDREAFGQIVARYQTLICSLAYSRTGSLAHSQDLAQEIFIRAWRDLAKLREPGKLRSWLCGIARHVISDSLRQEGREPSHRGESLDQLNDAAQASEPLPLDATISREEEAILWRAVERIPEIYREPLVLFYREHQSIAAVAASLELTEEAVKQRLSRGRKLLHEEVLSFVEGTLERTNPGHAFTLSVVASLPVLGLSSRTATLGAVTAKGSAAMKSAAAAGTLWAIANPLAILLGNALPYRLAMSSARSDEERTHIRALFRNVMAIALASTGVLLGLFWIIFSRQFKTSPGLGQMAMAGFVTLVICYLLALLGATIVTMPRRRRHHRRLLQERYRGQFPPARFEFLSSLTFLGLPLVHVRIGDSFSFLRPPVKAWIAVGDVAIGGFAAYGALAIAPFSIGGLAIGIFSLGGFVAGIFPMGALALGVWSYGAITAGWHATGAVAFG
ncbi:MAG TPA: sigma-70 family RNA polymerase sigma factor, partial [Verrucomicrobiae bacterium]|nr:sigma-70 family RNA polymerase sigma factor [Verrucomicrobiae bacterium]